MSRRAQGAGSVYARKDGRFAAAASYEGKRITKYGQTKKEAWDNLQTYLDDLKAGKVVTGPKQTVKHYLEHWLEDSRRLRVRVATLVKYRSILHVHLIPAFGHLQLSQLTREQVQSFYSNLLSDGSSPRTIGLIHAVLASALKDAVLDGLLAKNVCDRVTLPRVESYEPRVLVQGECKRLVDAAVGHRLWFVLLLAITTGARCGELLALRWSDIDVEARLLHIHRTVADLPGFGHVENAPKTTSGVRKVRLSQVVIDAFYEHKVYVGCIEDKAGSQWKENDLVFPDKQGGYISRRYFSKQFGDLLAKASLPHIHFHDLRHSAATLLLASGVNVKVIQEMLGHSDIKMTLGMYSHVMPDMQEEAAKRMDDLFNNLK